MLKVLSGVLILLTLPLVATEFLWVMTMSMMFILSLIILFFLPTGMNLLVTNFFFFFDGLNIPLISLMFWIMGLMIMSSFKIKVFNDKFGVFIFNLVSLSLVLLLYFMVDNLASFYLMFEGSLIPTMVLIMMWGYQPERLQASMYFMIYTVMASLPLLVGILMIWSENCSLSFLMTSWDSPVMGAIYGFWWFSLMMAFMVKLPLYTVHLWLPKAHVEAPVAGSMILAAILLKLGSYGMMRVISMFPEFSLKLIPMFSSLSMVGACITSAICIRQPDMKSMIAYSSIGHMGLLVVGIFSYTSWGWCGSLGMMVAHGFCSSGLFSIANMVYENIGSRSLMLVKGLMMVFPCMSVWWFMLVIANMSAPPSFNLLSEIFLLVSILSSSFWYSVTFVISSFLVGSFCLFLFTCSQHGSISNFLSPLNYSVGRNYLVLVLHVLPLYFLLLQPYSFFLIL